MYAIISIALARIEKDIKNVLISQRLTEHFQPFILLFSLPAVVSSSGTGGVIAGTRVVDSISLSLIGIATPPEPIPPLLTPLLEAFDPANRTKYNKMITSYDNVLYGFSAHSD